VRPAVSVRCDPDFLFCLCQVSGANSQAPVANSIWEDSEDSLPYSGRCGRRCHVESSGLEASQLLLLFSISSLWWKAGWLWTLAASTCYVARSAGGVGADLCGQAEWALNSCYSTPGQAGRARKTVRAEFSACR